MIDTDAILKDLNDAQREAVLATEGPVLILAGAGSGKTRVITSRVAYLIGTERALPHEIIAVTFTNKAAGEMKDRIVRLLGPDSAGARIGTFHALCLRILRREGSRIDLPSEFQVYDTADQVAVMKGVLKDLGIEESERSPREILSRISHAKNRMETLEEFSSRAVFPAAKTLARCWDEYRTRMKKLGAVDFDDLILETLRLLDTHGDIAERYARGCRYLLVDEYQDTNRCQYRLIRALSAAHRNVCCVGDSDQSIYRFRGADITNILDFEKDFPDARVVKLERNYRSTKTILKAASAIIEKIDRRHEKRLWTENEEGIPLHYHRARDDRDEAEAVSRIVTSLSDALPSGEIAVLYRTNNQSRLVEEALVRAGIRYRIVGSLRFYERKEIKDLLAYLRLLLTPGDDVSFLRAVNTPPRGIGKTTLDQIAETAAIERISLCEAARRGIAGDDLQARARTAVQGFFETLDRVRARTGLGGSPPAQRATRADRAGPSDDTRRADEPGPIVPLLTALIEEAGFRDYLEKAHPGDFEERHANVEALVSAAAEYDEQDPGGGLQGFLDRSSLRSDTDDVQGDTGVTLLTVHSAKGLEFGAVVLTGLEENLFPHARSRESAEELEEERRLCYVAITRAKKRLILTNAVLRRSFGDFVENPPSRFLDELPPKLMTYSESSPWSGVEGDPLRSGRSLPEGGPPRTSSTGGGGLWTGIAGTTSPPRRPTAGGGSMRRFSSARGSGSSGTQDRPAFSRRPVVSVPGLGSDEYAVGRTVTHPMFGRGTILHIEGAGDSLKLTIRFLTSGTRKILPRHTTLVVHD